MNCHRRSYVRSIKGGRIITSCCGLWTYTVGLRDGTDLLAFSLQGMLAKKRGRQSLHANTVWAFPVKAHCAVFDNCYVTSHTLRSVVYTLRRCRTFKQKRSRGCRTDVPLARGLSKASTYRVTYVCGDVELQVLVQIRDLLDLL